MALREQSRRLVHLDARLKIITAACFGLLTWRAGPLGLAAYGLGVGWAALVLGAFRAENRRTFAAYGLFVLFWMAFALALASWEGSFTWSKTLPETGLLGLRLCVLLFIGLSLALSASPRQLGLAFSWFLRPVLGRRAWTAALSLSLLVHFLPLAWTCVRQVRQAIRLRNPRQGKVRRALLLSRATLRILGQKTWTQTVAIAGRGLDSPEAWEPRFTPQPLAWLGALGVVVVGGVLAYLRV